MEELCRLCCSTALVKYNIFDESNSIYRKMSTYLPVKVNKNDRLPQKICDKCSVKLEEFYQFCNTAIDVQNRLQAALAMLPPDIGCLMDLTLRIKDNVAFSKNNPVPSSRKFFTSLSTQTDPKDYTFEDPEVKEELKVFPSEVKAEPPTKCESQVPEHDNGAEYDFTYEDNFLPSDCSEDISLKSLKKKKRKSKKLKPVDDKLPKEEDKDSKNIKKRRKKLKMHVDAYVTPPVEACLSDSVSRDGTIAAGMLPSKNEALGISADGGKITMLNLESISQHAIVGNGIRLKEELPDDDDSLAPLLLESMTMLGTDLLKTENYVENETWHCCVCFMECPNRTDMIQHYRSHSTVEGCRDDPESAGEEPASTEPGRYTCRKCNRVFSQRAALEKHATKQLDCRPYRCSLCEKTFREVAQILRHGKTHSYSGTGLASVAECVVSRCPTAQKGELCPDSHLVVRPRRAPEPVSKRFVCDLCTEGFVYMRYLIEHRNRTHPEASSRKFVNRCMHCAREFAHLNSLRRHLRSHTGERNFLCNVCGKALSSREHLKFHIRIHTGYKPNVCKTCGKGFVKKCNLVLHERVHSGEKPHVCSHCGKAFSQRSTLVIHERYHSGVRPYVCTLCGKGFVAKGLLSMHLKTTCI